MFCRFVVCEEDFERFFAGTFFFPLDEEEEEEEEEEQTTKKRETLTTKTMRAILLAFKAR
jgi:hypothetical protein